MIVDELITLLEFDVKGKDKAISFDNILNKIEESAKAIVLSLTAAATSVGYFADRVSKELSQNYEWAKSVGVAADSYQKFEYAAEIVGGSLDDIKGNLEKWVRVAKSSGMTLEQIFIDEAKRIKGMSIEEARLMLSAKDYSDTSIRLITQGENKLREYFAQAEVIPEKHLEAAREYAITWRKVTFEINKAMSAAVVAALPYIQNVLKAVGNFISVNKEIFKSSVTVFFKSLAITLSMVIKPIKVIINTFMWLLRIFDKATLGVGKYILVIGALVTAFEALAVAITMKVVRSIASLMGKLPGLLTSSIEYFHLINRLIVKLATAGVQQTILNTELFTAVKAWWMNVVAVWAQTKATAANTIQVIKNVIAAKAQLFTMKGLTLAVQNLTKNLIIGAVKVFPKIIAQTWIIFLHLVKITTLMATRLLVLIPRLITAISIGLVKGIGQAILALKAFRLSMISTMINQVAAAAIALKTSLIPALAAAKIAAIKFSVALSANPIGLIAAAIALIVLNIYIWIKYWREILTIYKKIWQFMTYISNLFNPILIIIRGIRVQLQWYINVFNFFVRVSAIIRKYWNDLPGLIEVIKNKIKDFFERIFGEKSIGEWILNGLKFALRKAKDLLLSIVFNPYIEEINKLIGVLNKIPGVNIEKIEQFGQPASYNGAAVVPNNNYQNNRSYNDNRNIIINTNATSGPAIASYMKVNDFTRGGYAMSGAY